MPARVYKQGAFLIVLAILAAAVLFLVFEPSHWRRGTTIFAASAVAAGVFRLVLPDARVGMLRVRRRWIDCTCYFAAAALILTASFVVG